MIFHYLLFLIGVATSSRLGYAEMRLILAGILRNFNIKLSDDSEEWDKGQRRGWSRRGSLSVDSLSEPRCQSFDDSSKNNRIIKLRDRS